MLKLSREDAIINPDIDAIYHEWIDKGGDFGSYNERIEAIILNKYGVKKSGLLTLAFLSLFLINFSKHQKLRANWNFVTMQPKIVGIL